MALGLSPTEIINKGVHPLLNIHPEWERIFLNKIADVLNGYAFDAARFNNTGTGKPLIRIRDVGKDRTDTYLDDKWNETYLIQNGDILIGMDGDFRCAIWRGGEALLNQRVCKITPKSRSFDPKFLYYILQPYLNAINAETSAVTVKHLSSRTIQEIPLPNPPLPVQQQIVACIEELFSELEAGVHELQTALARLKTYRQAVLHHYLNNPDWERVKLREVVDGIQIGPFGTQLHQHDYISDGIPLVNPTHIKKGKIVPDNDLSVSEEKYRELSNYYLKPGDTIMGRRGEMARCALITERESGWLCGTGSLYIRPNRALVDPQFLSMVLGSSATKSHLEQEASGSTMSNLNLKILKNTPISFPGLATQTQIVAEIEERLSEADAMETTIRNELKRAENLRQSILKQAFAGKLVTGDAGIQTDQDTTTQTSTPVNQASGQLNLF